MLLPLAFVLFFSFRINQMSASSARTLFFRLRRGHGPVAVGGPARLHRHVGARAFFVTARRPSAALSLYGYTTKRDLSAFGSFLVMGLIGLVIASVVNLFVQSSAFQFGLSILSC